MLSKGKFELGAELRVEHRVGAVDRLNRRPIEWIASFGEYRRRVGRQG